MKYNQIEEKIIIPNEKENELQNFKNGLRIFKDKCKYLNEQTLEDLLLLYGNISILIDKSIKKFSKEIAYPCQELQHYIYVEINRRINK